jgi:6-phosphogluconolactonase (cycloisomerase 2 family)
MRLLPGLVVVAWCAFAQAAFGFGRVPGSPFATGNSPDSAMFSPSGGLLAVANYWSPGSVSVFSVDGSTGSLTEVRGSPFRAGAEPSSVAFSRSGGLLAVANNFSGASGDVSVFSVNQTTGALRNLPGSPFAAGFIPDSVAFSPSGGLLAVGNFGTNSVSVFSVASGALHQVRRSPFPAGGTEPVSVAFSPSGRWLAATGASDMSSAFGGAVSVFSVDRASGALHQVLGSPFPAGDNPRSVAFSPDGQLVAVAMAATSCILAVACRCSPSTGRPVR